MRRHAVLAVVPLIAVAFLAPMRAHASGPVTWNGNAAPDTNWSTAGNWVGGVAPTNGDDVVFPASATSNPFSTDDIAGLSLHSITFQADQFHVNPDGGNDPLTVTSTIADTSSSNTDGGCDWFSVPLVSTNLVIDASGISSHICLDSTVTVATGTTFTGSGGNAYIYGGSNDFGTVDVSTGNPFVLADGGIGNGNITVDSGGSITFSTFFPSTTRTFSNALIMNGGAIYTESPFPVAPTTVTLTGAITVNSTAAESTMWTADDVSVVVSGPVTGADPLTTFGVGTVQFTGDMSGYSGVLGVGADFETGTTLFETSGTFPVHVAGTAVVGGAGTVGDLTVTGSMSLLDSSRVFRTHAVSMESTGTFVENIDGTTVGTQYGQLMTNGAVTLSNPTLTVNLGYTPSVNTAFVILKNGSGAAITGTFNGLGEGAAFTVGDQWFRITYRGNGENDIVITAIPPVPPVPDTGVHGGGADSIGWSFVSGGFLLFAAFRRKRSRRLQ